MCGIAGIVDQAPIADLERPLRLMQAALRHRGPDDAGIFVSPCRHAGFSHTRLSIIDLSPAGHQPMSTPDGRYTIAFNGEIYNFRELRQKLTAGGVQFRSNSDTEVILRMYERFGAGFVEQLRGMFAIALWDERERLCLLARDPLGIKPLYVRLNEGAAGYQLAFASEVRALVAGGLATADISPEGLLGFLRAGSVPEPFTIIQGVECLPAGSQLIWQRGSIRRQTYWHYPPPPATGSDLRATDHKGVVSTLRSALLDSIQAHHVSDVPVGIFLSGGIDSTAVLALSRAIGQKNIQTFSISFAETGYQEGPTARRTATEFGTEHHEWKISAADAGGLIDDFWQSLDQPTVDGFNTWCVARAARQQGMKVVLSGLGGDEFFAGYPSFVRAPTLARAQHIPGFIRRPVGRALERYGRSPQHRRMGEFLRGTSQLPDAWNTIHSIFSWREARQLAASLLGREPDDLPDVPTVPTIPAGYTHGKTSREVVSLLEVTQFMRNQLLRDSDVTSMAWGLELRVPLVDSRLAEVVARLPARERLRPGKKLLTEAVPEIPEWVLSRPKSGFQFPFAEWMGTDWADRFRAIAANSPVPLTTWYQKWMVALFQNRRDHFVSISHQWRHS